MKTLFEKTADIAKIINSMKKYENSTESYEKKLLLISFDTGCSKYYIHKIIKNLVYNNRIRTSPL